MALENKYIERVAKEYCKLLGQDPDEIVTVSIQPPTHDSAILTVHMTKKCARWETHVGTITGELLLRQAFNTVNKKN